MKCAIQFAGVVWLGAAALLYADQTKPPKNPPPPKNTPPPVAAKVEPPKGGAGGGVPKPSGGVPKGAAKLPNPGTNPIDRLRAMTPEQRERVIEKLGPQQQINVRKMLANFDKQSDEQKQRQLERFRMLWNLPPEKGQLVSREIEAFNHLPEDRREAVKAAYVRLSKETPEGRAEILARPQFQRRFSEDELKILSVLPEYWPAPAAGK
jgi:hypothetical protein